jgi:hypothetical protein
MARRRRSNIGFTPNGESELDKIQVKIDPVGAIVPASKTVSAPPVEGVEKTSKGILPNFDTTERDDQAPNINSLGNQFPDEAYYDESKLKDHLASVNIADRTGNYLLSIGLPASGKTVLQSFLTYAMSVAGNLSAKADVTEENGEINHQAQQLRTSWLDAWKVGRFPYGTTTGEEFIREIRLDITNLENKSQRFNFSFLEISGENFKDVVPTAISAPTLFKRIEAFLTNDKIRLNIAFVLKTDEASGETTNDALFTNFIEFIEVQLKVDVTQKVGLIVVVPNPKLVFGEEDWRRMRSNQKSDRNFYNKRVRDYIYKNFPATYTTFDRWNTKKRAITIFHIGDETEGRLKNEDFRDARSFINLNYNFFTGKNLEPKNSFWKRIFGLK